jgi:hypothetical protein
MKLSYFSLSLFLISHTTLAALDCELLLIPPSQEREYLLQNSTRLVGEINQSTLRLKKMIGQTKLRRTFSGGMHAADIEYYDGVPNWVKVITPHEDMVFRHYGPNSADKIIDSQKLIAGPRAYILPDSHLKKQYDDLTGIFFTKPENNPHNLWLGFTTDTPHVDFTLPKGTMILDLGEGNYLIPGNPSYNKWIEEAYQKYKSDGIIPDGLADQFLLIDRRGGVLRPLEFPIFLKNKKHAQLITEVKKFRSEIEQGYQLPDHFTNAYFARRIEPYLQRPSYTPSANSDQFLFRGMFIELSDLEEILEKGMSINKAVWSAVGGRGLYYTSSEQEAISYIFQNAGKKTKGVGVVFKVKRTGDMNLMIDPQHNPTNTIFKSDLDLLPEQIENIYLYGQYGLEDIDSIFAKAKSNKIKPHTEWTNQFEESGLTR